jgi:hypothetical protein
MRFPVLGIFASLALTLPVRAATIRVPTDYPTIQAAVDSAATSDTVLVAPGTYYGDPGSATCVVFDKAISLIGEGGAGVTTIDGEGARRVLGTTSSGPRTIRGFTIRNGSAGSGAGLYVSGTGSTCTIADNVFEDNHATGQGGGVACYSNSGVVMRDNTFRSNGGNGAAVYSDVIPLDFSSNVVMEDTPNVAVSAVLWYTSLSMTDCVIANSGPALDLVSQCGTGPDIQRCTIFGSPAIYCHGDIWSTIGETVIVGNMYHSFYFTECDAAHTFDHVDLFGSLILSGCTDEIQVVWNQPNLNADPLFCNPAQGDFTLAAASPCLPQNNPWGVLVGATGQGCLGPVSLRHESWGSIKARYR